MIEQLQKEDPPPLMPKPVGFDLNNNLQNIPEGLFGNNGQPGEWLTGHFNSDSFITLTVPSGDLESIRLRYTTSAKRLLQIFKNSEEDECGKTEIKLLPRFEPAGFVQCGIVLSEKQLAKLSCLHGEAYRYASRYLYGSVVIDFDLNGLMVGANLPKFYKLGTRRQTRDCNKVSHMLLMDLNQEFEHVEYLTPFNKRSKMTLYYDDNGNWTHPGLVFSSELKLDLVRGNATIKFLDHSCNLLDQEEGEGFCPECKLRTEASGYILNTKLFGGTDYSDSAPRYDKGIEIAVKNGDITTWDDGTGNVALQLFALGFPLHKREDLTTHLAAVFPDFSQIVGYFEKNPARTFNYLESSY